jgi:hypothetical protein
MNINVREKMNGVGPVVLISNAVGSNLSAARRE